MLVLLMKFSYLCIVNQNEGFLAQGSQNMFSGLTEFAACPERKNEVAKGDKTITNNQ